MVGLTLERGDIKALTLKGLAFLISGVCGSYAVIQAGKIALPEKVDWIISKIGMNSITIYGTHHIIYATIGVLLGISDFKSTPIMPGLIMLFGVAILEIPTIYMINRWAPCLAGKHKQKRFSETLK